MKGIIVARPLKHLLGAIMTFFEQKELLMIAPQRKNIYQILRYQGFPHDLTARAVKPKFSIKDLIVLLIVGFF